MRTTSCKLDPAASANPAHTARRAWAADPRELAKLAAMLTVFGLFYFLPTNVGIGGAANEAVQLTADYAREHVLLCLVPALFIAGAIGVFVSQAAIMRYLGPDAPKPLAYGVASVSGSILAVCSCTILPLFAGIWRMGAGLGPATAFLYSGPAINVLAIILTARVLGAEIGLARAIGAVGFAILIGLLMHLIFRREERTKAAIAAAAMPNADPVRPLWQSAVLFGLMIAILVFANWGRPGEEAGLWQLIFTIKWPIVSIVAAALAIALVCWMGVAWWKMLATAAVVAGLGIMLPGWPVLAFSVAGLGLILSLASTPGEGRMWLGSTWSFAKLILPLLFIGVLIAGLLLGRPGHEGIIPTNWISASVGGNSLLANLFASVAGALMYFATLTEVPIVQGLIGSGMGKGPALALLLAGPALSLPNLLVLRGVMGTQKTLVYLALVVVMATVAGIVYGSL
jgi:uncharacterized membrane protein YraQ (UPF0718 family)